MCTHICVPWYACGGQRATLRSQYFHHMDPREQIRVIWLRGKYLLIEPFHRPMVFETPCQLWLHRQLQHKRMWKEKPLTPPHPPWSAGGSQMNKRELAMVTENRVEVWMCSRKLWNLFLQMLHGENTVSHVLVFRQGKDESIFISLPQL